jgi:hypothetical protein
LLPSTAAARRRVASQLTNISTCVPASTTQTTATTPISTLASMNTQVQAMTLTLPSVSVHVGVDIHIPVVWLVLLSATVGIADTVGPQVGIIIEVR